MIKIYIRLVRDQEAVGSNPVTPTKKTLSLGWEFFSFFVVCNQNQAPEKLI